MRYRRRLLMPVLAVLAVLAVLVAGCAAEEATTEPAATTVPAAQPEPTTTTAPEAETEPAPVSDTSQPEPATGALREDRARGFVEAEPGAAAPRTTTSTTAAPEPGCHTAYTPCLPNLPGDALDCGDLTADQKPVTVNEIGVDPYRLDRDGDGRGCTS